MGRLIFEGSKREYDAYIKSMSGRCPDIDGDCPGDGCKAHWEAAIGHRLIEPAKTPEQEAQ